MVNSMVFKKNSVRVQVLATIIAIASAVVVPQLFHMLGAVSGLGTVLGKTFLPMHLPIILAGLLAGPVVGCISGALGPLVSFALSGMPMVGELPFMMIELAVYGLISGLLCNVKINIFVKVVLAQLAGRAVRAIALVIAIYALGNETLKIASIWISVVTGLPGMLLQWCLLPLLMFWLSNRSAPKEKGLNE